MKKELYSKPEISGRRGFVKKMSTCATGIALGSFGRTGYAANREKIGLLKRRTSVRSGNSSVSFVTGTDQREASYQALKPLEKEIENAIQGKQVVIKVNMGEVIEGHECCATDVDQVRGILDFLTPIYDRKIIVAEGTANYTDNIVVHFEKYGYNPLLREYNAQFMDTNDQSSTTKCIKSEKHHPLAINIIDTFLDPNVYMISATRLKTHGSVIVTLSEKNIAMGSPLHKYWDKDNKNKNEKKKMHSGGNRGLSFNLFHIASMGVQPDLAVLDGVIGVEGNGPWNGFPIEHGVALASTDWVAADRLGTELMGVDWNEVKYLQWCAKAGMGQDDLSKIKIIGTDYKKHIVKYKLHENIETQREWIREDFEEEI